MPNHSASPVAFPNGRLDRVKHTGSGLTHGSELVIASDLLTDSPAFVLLEGDACPQIIHKERRFEQTSNKGIKGWLAAFGWSPGHESIMPTRNRANARQQSI